MPDRAYAALVTLSPKVGHGTTPHGGGTRTPIIGGGFRGSRISGTIVLGGADVPAPLRRMASDTNNVRGWKALLAPLSPFDRHVLVLISQAKPPIGKSILKFLARTEGKAPTVARFRAALERLRRVGILRGTCGEYLIEDPLLMDYLLANGPVRLL